MGRPDRVVKPPAASGWRENCYFVFIITSRPLFYGVEGGRGGGCNSMVMFISSDVNGSGELPGEQR